MLSQLKSFEYVVPGQGSASPDSWHGGLCFRLHYHFLSKAFKKQSSLILPTQRPYKFFCNSIISSVLVSFATITNNPKVSSLQQHTFFLWLSHFGYYTSAPCIFNPETCVKEAAFTWDKLSLWLMEHARDRTELLNLFKCFWFSISL